MAFVDANMPLNMFSGFDFSSLNYGSYYSGTSSSFTVDYYDGTSESFYGYGFTYDYYYGTPTGSGTVTDYHASDSYGSTLLSVSGMNVPASWIVNAASTYSTADDAAVVVTALAGNDTIYGSDYADVLAGFDGNDTIFGFGGNDSMYGGAGNDLVAGDGGNDTVFGEAGSDILVGGAGNDRLVGGGGRDYFVFDTRLSSANNVDRITDFNVRDDTFFVDNAVMRGLGAENRTLSSGAFWKSTTGLAHDGNDRIIYETDTGWLNYDSNGRAAGGAVHIAKLAPNLALTHADFFVT